MSIEPTGLNYGGMKHLVFAQVVRLYLSSWMYFSLYTLGIRLPNAINRHLLRSQYHVPLHQYKDSRMLAVVLPSKLDHAPAALSQSFQSLGDEDYAPH